MRLIIKKQPKPSKKLPSNAVQFYDFPEVLQPLQTLHQRHLRSDCVKKKRGYAPFSSSITSYGFSPAQAAF